MSDLGWNLRFDGGVEEALEALDRAVAERMAEKLEWLTNNAATVHHRPLSRDLAGLYRLRVGDWRVIYALLQEERVVLVVRLGHRREVYDE